MTDTFTIYPIDKSQGRMYCGATVLALLTGKPRATIHRDFNRMVRAKGKTRRKAVYYRDGTYKTTKRVPWPLTSAVKGMYEHQLEALMTKYKIASAHHKNNRYGSLRQLVDDMEPLKKPIVVTVTGHFVLYYDGKVYDTHHPAGAPVTEHSFGRCRVKNYWVIRRQPAGKAAANV